MRIPRCKALTRTLWGGGRALPLGDVVVGMLPVEEDERMDTLVSAGGASHSHSASSTTTGRPQNTNVAVQASLPQNCPMIGTVIPAATASPMISPSLKRAATRPMYAGNQRRISTGTAV